MRVKLLEVREGRGTAITSPEDISRAMEQEAKADRETFWVLHLNTKNRIIEKELVSMGSLDNSLVHPREVFRKAIMNSCSSIITVHNHPSGDPSPSEEDQRIWSRLDEAGNILGIECLDHIVIGRYGYYSRKAERR